VAGPTNSLNFSLTLVGVVFSWIFVSLFFHLCQLLFSCIFFVPAKMKFSFHFHLFYVGHGLIIRDKFSLSLINPFPLPMVESFSFSSVFFDHLILILNL